MRRHLLHVLCLLAFAAAPISPYFHLAAIPHRYCTEHHAFEKEHPPAGHAHRPVRPQHPGQPEDEHDCCEIASFVLLSFEPAPLFAVATQPLAARDDATLLPRRPAPPRQRDAVSLAPKTSPPPSTSTRNTPV